MPHPPNEGPVAAARRPYARLQPLPRDACRIEGGFWARTLDQNREVSLRHGHAMLEREGQLDALRIAAGSSPGKPRGPVFSDSDVYKWAEAVCWELGRAPDPELASRLEHATELVEAAQRSDGYLNSHFQFEGAPEPWTDLRDAHELYCAGHLFQAAVAEARSTGGARLLDVSRKLADHLADRFGPGRQLGLPGHPEVETALVELYRVTHESRYLDLARFFIDERGKGALGPRSWFHGGIDYHVDEVPVREARDARGHAVRQLYLCAGAVDVALEIGDAALVEAMERVHRDLVETKLHVTGGIGARHQGEAFGAAHELPNARAYCETCAAIANVFFCWRMLLATGKAEYADLIELTLYNAFASGVAADGRHYFYVNPLSSDGTHRRAAWHGCACCPPNVMRLLSSLDHYVATRSDDGVAIHQYMGGRLNVSSDDDDFRLALEVTTRYPWDGRVGLRVLEATGRPGLSLRVPGWCDGATLTCNAGASGASLAGGYLRLERKLSAGDRLELNLPMRTRQLEAHPRVESCRGSVAVQRGPVVYCLEEVDVPEAVDFDALELDPQSPLEPEWAADLLGGVTALNATARVVDVRGWQSVLYRDAVTKRGAAGEAKVRLVPYFAWGNREPGKMLVWLPRAR